MAAVSAMKFFVDLIASALFGIAAGLAFAVLIGLLFRPEMSPWGMLLFILKPLQ